MRVFHYLSLGLVLIGTMPISARAQSATQLLQDGVFRYRNLEFDLAAVSLERALDRSQSRALTPGERADALTYLAASLIFLDRADSAAAVFSALVVFDPRYEPDQLVFPPEVTLVFEAAQEATRVISIEAPERTQFRLDRGRFSARLYASSVHDILAEVRTADGARRQTLYIGPIPDSLELTWDGRDSAGNVWPSGLYMLEVTSRDGQGLALRTVTMPLEVSVSRPDTLAVPPPAPDSLFLPEKTSSGSASAEALAGGVIAGAAVLLVPLAVAPRIDLSSARYVIAGALGALGVAGSLAYRPGKPLPDNIEYNEALRRELRAQTDSILSQNAVLRSEVRFVIIANEPTSVDRR